MVWWQELTQGTAIGL